MGVSVCLAFLLGCPSKRGGGGGGGGARPPNQRPAGPALAFVGEGVVSRWGGGAIGRLLSPRSDHTLFGGLAWTHMPHPLCTYVCGCLLHQRALPCTPSPFLSLPPTHPLPLSAPIHTDVTQSGLHLERAMPLPTTTNSHKRRHRPWHQQSACGVALLSVLGRLALVAASSSR